MGKFSELWEEINEKEVELSRLMAEYEGEKVIHQGKRGVVDFINPPKDTAYIEYDDGDKGWAEFDELTFV